MRTLCGGVSALFCILLSCDIERLFQLPLGTGPLIKNWLVNIGQRTSVRKNKELANLGLRACPSHALGPVQKNASPITTRTLYKPPLGSRMKLIECTHSNRGNTVYYNPCTYILS